MEIGQQFRQIRENMGVSRRYVALQAGLTEYTIYNFECGRNFPSQAHLSKILGTLNISIDFKLTQKALPYEEENV